MKKKILIMMPKGLAILLAAILLLALSGCFALEEPEESSGAVAAPTIAAESQDEPEADAAEEESMEEASEDETMDEEHSDSPDGANSYEIDTSRSEARFSIEEVLRGDDVTVVGVSSNLAGQIVFDIANPAASQIGEILINARDFATDNDFRNRAISNKILLTDTHEFITFMPKELIGLPDSAAVGESYEFQIMGDLTIIGETQEVTFDVLITVESETELQGLASVSILYADFGITIPFSQAVSAVNDDVLLELDFVAVAE